MLHWLHACWCQHCHNTRGITKKQLELFISNDDWITEQMKANIRTGRIYRLFQEKIWFYFQTITGTPRHLSSIEQSVTVRVFPLLGIQYIDVKMLSGTPYHVRCWYMLCMNFNQSNKNTFLRFCKPVKTRNHKKWMNQNGTACSHDKQHKLWLHAAGLERELPGSGRGFVNRGRRKAGLELRSASLPLGDTTLRHQTKLQENLPTTYR